MVGGVGFGFSRPSAVAGRCLGVHTALSIGFAEGDQWGRDDEPQARPRSRRKELRLGYYGEILGAKNGRSEVIKKWRQPMGRGEILRVEGFESFLRGTFRTFFRGGGETLTPLLLGYRRLARHLVVRKKTRPPFLPFPVWDEIQLPWEDQALGKSRGSMLNVTFKLYNSPWPY